MSADPGLAYAGARFSGCDPVHGFRWWGMDDLAASSLVGIAAFAGGLLFGAVVQRTHFCTMGAIADLVLFRDWRRMRAWLLAIAVAILGSQLLEALAIVDLSGTLYRASDVLWLGALLGGLLFGFG
ncbi:MAG: YeeE/YedE thiosulfate transporter family protein, partial [Geminicoccaceae bacterium]